MESMIQKSMSELSSLVESKMASFQSNLEKAQEQTGAPTLHISTLATDFFLFKSSVKSALAGLKEMVERLHQDVDRLETRSRRKILLLHGLTEAKDQDLIGQVIGILHSRLSIPQASKADISRCYRMGRARGEKPRPVLVEFRGLETRNAVWLAKKALKGSGITLSEFLTKCRHELFMAARDKLGVPRSWTSYGCVFVQAADGKRQRILTSADLDVIVQSDAAAQADAAAQKSTVQSKTDDNTKRKRTQVSYKK